MNDSSLGAGFGFMQTASNMATNFQNHADYMNQLALSQREADTTRQFNHAEAMLARQYNSIGAISKRLRDAGFNPDLMYGSATGLQTGQMASGSPSSIPGHSPYISPFGADVANSVLTAKQLAIAQQNADSQSKLADSEASLNESKKIESEANAGLLNAKTITEGSVKLKVDKDIELDDAQINELNAYAKNLDADVARINAQVRELNALTDIYGYQAIQEFIKTSKFESYCNEILNNLRSQTSYNSALTNLTNQEFKEAVESWVYRLLGIQKTNSDGGLLDQTIENLRLSNEGLSVDVDIKKATKDFNINTHSGPLGYTSFAVNDIIAPLLDGITSFFWAKGMMKNFGKGAGKSFSGSGSQGASKGVVKGAGSSPSPSSSPSPAPQNLPSFNWFGPNGEPKHVNTNNPRHLSDKQRSYLDKYYPRGWYIDSKGDIHSK